MVNKQYNVNKTKNYSPPPLRSHPVVSSQPNPLSSLQSTGGNGGNLKENNVELLSDEVNFNVQQNVYGRNIALYNTRDAVRDDINDDKNINYNNDRLSVKDLTISDIGRFQYILQMDREMGVHNDLCHSSTSDEQNASSKTNSLSNSQYNIQFWKAGSHSPFASSFSRSTSQRTKNLRKFFKIIWRFSKWPLGLLLICSILGLIVYFLVADKDVTSFSNHNNEYLVEENLSIDFNDFHNSNDLEMTSIKTIAATTSRPSFGFKEDLLAIFVKTPIHNSDGFQIWTSTEQSGKKKEPAVTEHVRKTSTIPLKDYTKAKNFNEPPTESPGDILGETEKPVVPVIGFTSGHQNNFGIPIEEDERILKMLNEQLLKLEQDRENLTISTSTSTDSSLYRTKVSPTLPILPRFEITTEGIKKNITEDGICASTSLPLCRGISPYDLTTPKNPSLSNTEYQHFQYLINSKCSNRVAEFVCLVLEPECRPTKMGTLQPCKRICKSILEPCAHIIASSEILTQTFDCDAYEDSSDRNVCEDPTRKGHCYANEYKCLDSSCIPLQWKCDNIKDCYDGEDEYECKFCERDEFRCLSNDKCIPDKWRCDDYEDCPDASDENDCLYDEPTTFASGFGSERIYPFVQVQAPNSPPNEKPLLKVNEEDQDLPDEDKHKYSNYDNVEHDKYEPTAAENVQVIDKRNKTNLEVADKIDIIKLDNSTVNLNGTNNLSNFQDSKEIMMTSDSENDFKFTSTSKTLLTTSHLSPCPENELRCISGVCISVNQICDRVSDCEDGADEAMCVYKD